MGIRINLLVDTQMGSLEKRESINSDSAAASLNEERFVDSLEHRKAGANTIDKFVRLMRVLV